ncbi:hypothetical protein [Bacillus sp. AK128]
MRLLLSCIIFVLTTISFSNFANANYTSREFQDSFYEFGFKEVNLALFESKEHFKKDIPLPVQIPPISFTHSFGRFSDLKGDINDGFEIEYLHKDKPKNHYMIRIHPVKYGLPIRKEHIEQTLKLRDGSKAYYSTNIAKGFNLLVFEKKDWQYVLNINKGVSDQVTPEILVEIANSINP